MYSLYLIFHQINIANMQPTGTALCQDTLGHGFAVYQSARYSQGHSISFFGVIV